MVASRLIERMRPRKLSLAELTARQFHISPLSNRVLLWLAQLEQAMRRMAIPLPFGGSQILVARRPSEP
jgi:hypothetical protein